MVEQSVEQRNESPGGEWGPRRSTKGRDEPPKDTNFPIREEATAEAGRLVSRTPTARREVILHK